MKKDIEWLKKELKKCLNTSLNRDNHYSYGNSDAYNIALSYVDELEKPVIPKFVADWIEEYKSIGLHCAMKDLYGNKDYDNVARWLYHSDRETNLEKEKMLMRAWLDDYDVEVEKVYQVRDKNDTILCKVYGKVMIVGKAWCIGYGQEVYNLTEKEIKDYDERYWVFADEVTE